MLLEVTLVMVAVAPGLGSVSVGFNLPKDLMCCPLLNHGHTEEYELCAAKFDSPPQCEHYQTKCLYNDKWYMSGETIVLLADKCIKLTCVASASAKENSWPMVKAENTDPGVKCCESKGQLHPSGHILYEHTQHCTREVCTNGIWLTQVDNNCCVFENKVYFPDEDINHGPGGTNCWRRWCSNGTAIKTSLPCCCVKAGKFYDCGTKLHPTVPSCNVDMCVDGRIKRSHNPGCCIVDTNLYRNNDIIQSFPNCTTHVCVDGQVMQLPSQECCRDLEGKWILRNQVVESNERKCLLKVCQGNNTILDKSLDDVCNCCRLGGQLYQENQVVVMSPCISLVCLNNKWERNDTLHNCQECFSAGDPHIRTLDGMYYNFYGKCNYTMVQRGMTGFTSPFIAAHFKTCGPPFRDAMSCNGEITIKHNDHIALVITEDATVQVNGARVTLPYSMPEENIFIWDEGMDIKIITFNGFYVRYTKHAVMPGMYVYAPSAEMNQTWSGLCGLYNGVREDDPHDSDGVLTDVANFATSWNTGVSSKIPSCKDDVKDVQATCTEELREKFEPKCKALLEMARANCTPILTEDGCLEDMCGCAPEKEHTCLLSIKHGLEHECGPITMDCPAAPDLTSPSSTCVDLDGVVRQDWEKFLVDCKEYVCRQGKIFLIKDGKRRCCSDVRNLTVYRNREKFTTGSGANCQTYVCKNGTISVYGTC